jgi:hypothetical protein
MWPSAFDSAREIRIRLASRFDSRIAPAIGRTNCAGKDVSGASKESLETIIHVLLNVAVKE